MEGFVSPNEGGNGVGPRELSLDKSEALLGAVEDSILDGRGMGVRNGLATEVSLGKQALIGVWA